MTESRLAEAARKGDPDAFGRLVLAHALVARRIGYSVLGNWDDAEDAVQEGALAAWRAIARFDPARSFRPWFLRIVANAALDWRRRRRVRAVEPLDERIAGSGVAPDVAAERADARDRIAGALEALPERQRVAVTLFDYEGYSHPEIAAILEVPEGTVRSYVWHARRALRRALGALEEELV